VVYTVLGVLTLVVIYRLGFPTTVGQLIRYIFDIGFIIGVHRLIHPAWLEPLAGQLCPSTWDWQRWTRWVRPARRMLMFFAVVNVLVYFIGFQGLAVFSATAMTVTLGLVFLWGVLSLVGRLAIHFFFHAEYGWLGRKLPDRSELLERLCGNLQRIFELAVTVSLVFSVFAVWGIEPSRLLGTLAWLNWEMPLGSFHLTPLNVILAGLVVYLGAMFSKLSTQVLGARIFPRTGWDIGVQYTISTILHYVVLILSGLLALNILGFPLGNLALIMGAVGVGVGLGLQNIVSNFFSGLILLIERPIKVGDLLVIDGQWGEVKEIRIRSTLFQTFDRSVLIIPNSDLTSGKILNWTHYGRGITRIKLQVGVSYDSDVRRVTEILRDICRENSRVMADPSPNISFSAYGESSLDFIIMVHVRAPEDRVPATHELNTAIFDAFKEHGIEIPFPQRDLYIKNWPRQLMEEKGDGESVNR
jgi:potassium-dependent mechanosensitive channel